MSGPVFDPEVLKRCVMSPEEAAAFKARATTCYMVYGDADGHMLFEDGAAVNMKLARAEEIIRSALEKMDRYVNRQGAIRMAGKSFSEGSFRNPCKGEHYPAVQSVMDRMRDFLKRP